MTLELDRFWIISLLIMIGHVSCTHNRNSNRGPSSQTVDCLEPSLINSDYISLDTASLEIHLTNLKPDLKFYKYDDYRGYIVSEDILFTDVLEKLKNHGRLMKNSIELCDLKSTVQDIKKKYYTTISGTLITARYAMLSCQVYVNKNEVIEYYLVFSNGTLLDRSISYSYMIPTK